MLFQIDLIDHGGGGIPYKSYFNIHMGSTPDYRTDSDIVEYFSRKW